MVPIIIECSDLNLRLKEITQLLTTYNLTKNHPNVLWIGEEEKLGVKEARKVTEHLSLKPYQEKSQAVVIINADELTPEAQNALLKTLEESSESSIIILGVSSEDKLLSTVLSRCQLHRIQNEELRMKNKGLEFKQVEGLGEMSIGERFQVIEKVKDKEQFFQELIQYYRQKLLNNPTQKLVEFSKELNETEKWWQANVNQRGILEYLMLILPK